jgi:hypothetical protein
MGAHSQERSLEQQKHKVQEEEIDDEEDTVVITRHSSDTDASEAIIGADSTISLAAWNEAYQEENDSSSAISEIIESTLTLEDPEPSPEHLRRSKMIQQKFQDPVWKQKWYESRWGNRKRREINEERLQQRLSSVRQVATEAETLAPLATMTEEEITEAVVEYMKANQKRSLSRRSWVNKKKVAKEQRKSTTTNDRTILKPVETFCEKSRDQLLMVNSTALNANRKKYSERAKRAYRTRLERKSIIRKQRPSTLEDDLQKTQKEKQSTIVVSPQTFLDLIELSTNNGNMPQVEWIKNAMKDDESERVKKVFISILRRYFDLKGRPKLPIERPALVLAQRSTKELGEYCIYLIREKEANQKQSDRHTRGLKIRKELNISTSEPYSCQKLVEFCIANQTIPLVSWIKTLIEYKNTRRTKQLLLALLDQWGVDSAAHWLPTDRAPLLTERSVKELGENCIHFIEQQQKLEEVERATNAKESSKDTKVTAVPSVALKLIEQALEKNRLPESDWIRQAMKTGKLKGRRELFLRLLMEQFQLYGRQWLPVDGDDASKKDDVPPFMSNRSVRDLGESCAILVRQRRLCTGDTE